MRILKDTIGKELPYQKVWEIAYENAIKNDKLKEFNQKFFDSNEENEDIIEWAVIDGKFPIELCNCTRELNVFSKRINDNLIEIYGCPKCDA